MSFQEVLDFDFFYAPSPFDYRKHKLLSIDWSLTESALRRHCGSAKTTCRSSHVRTLAGGLCVGPQSSPE